MPNHLVWLLLVLVVCVYGVPMRKDRIVKREVESVHFGNHQNKIPGNGGMADAQLIESYMGPQKRAQILKENINNDDESNEEDDEEVQEKVLQKKRVVPQSMEDWEDHYPSYYNYYNNLLNEYRPAPIISPEDNLPYVPAFRRRRASPIASAKSHQKKKSLPSSVSHFLRRRRSASYDMIEPVTLEELLKAAVAEEAVEQLEEELDDNDYYDRYEFKYPYYPGMVEYMAEEPEEDNEEEDYNISQEDNEGLSEEQPHWYDMSPAQAMQVKRRSETPKKRYSFPYIPLPGQKKKRDHIDSPLWGKIEDKRTQALKKRQHADKLYTLAQLLNEVQYPEENLTPVYQRAVL